MQIAILSFFHYFTPMFKKRESVFEIEEGKFLSPKFDENGLIPVITITGINVGTLIAFSIITETVFQWPGMGLLFINAVQFVDIPIMSAYLIMVAFLFVMINFIVDIAYYFIYPRIRFKDEETIK